MKLTLHPELARQALAAQAAPAVAAAANVLLAASRAAVPVESGRLRDSGSVSAEGFTARIAYAAPYAAIVHELHVKYLENPLNAPDVQAEALSALALGIRF